MRENRNGFTLVELLVTLSILGIITALSIPIIRNVQTQQTNRKYTTYLDSLGYASKLYVDSYSEDLFGYYARGCRYIKYEDLKKRDLIKDIDIKGISCDTEYTTIKVVKFRDKYYYQPYMGCGSETGGTVKASIFKPKQIENEDLCDANLNNTLIIREAYSAEEKRKIKQEHNPKVAIESYTGVSLTEKPQVKYAYIRSDKANASDMTLEDLNDMAKSWSDYISFDLFTDIEQNKFIKKAKLMTTYSNDKLTTHLNSDPQLTGKNFWLVLKVDRLKDYEGYDWKKIENPEGIENYVFFGPYIVDNTKPTVVGNTVTITSSETSYHHKKVTVKFKVDDNMTAKNKIKVCVSATNNCADTDYKTYSGGNVSKEITFTGSYDGNKRTVYIKVMDEAGNELVTSNDKYIVYKECSETDVTHFNASVPGTVQSPMLEWNQWATRGAVTAAIENHYGRTSGALSIYNNFGRHKINDGYAANGGNPRDRYFRSRDALAGVSLYQSFNLFEGNRLTLGFDYQHIYGRAFYTSRTTGEVIDTPNKQSGHSHRNEIAGYADFRQDITPWLTIDAGLRVDYHNITGTEWVPQGGIVVRPTDDGELKLMASKGFRNATMREMYLYPPSNEDLEPERLMSYELSWKQRLFDGAFTYGVNLFYINADNMIQNTMVDGKPRNVNTGSTENSGFELEWAWRIDRHWQLNNNLSMLHMTNPIVGAPKLKTYLGANYTQCKWNVAAGLQYLSGLYTQVGNNAAIEHVLLLNATVGYQLLRHVGLWVKGENLLARKYELVAGYPMPRATVMAGLNVTF